MSCVTNPMAEKQNTGHLDPILLSPRIPVPLLSRCETAPSVVGAAVLSMLVLLKSLQALCQGVLRMRSYSSIYSAWNGTHHLHFCRKCKCECFLSHSRADVFFIVGGSCGYHKSSPRGNRFRGSNLAIRSCSCSLSVIDAVAFRLANPHDRCIPKTSVCSDLALLRRRQLLLSMCSQNDQRM